VDGGFRPKSLDALQSDRTGEMGLSFSEKGEGVFNSGKESFHHSIKVKGEGIVLNADCGVRISDCSLKDKISVSKVLNGEGHGNSC